MWPLVLEHLRFQNWELNKPAFVIVSLWYSGMGKWTQTSTSFCGYEVVCKLAQHLKSRSVFVSVPLWVGIIPPVSVWIEGSRGRHIVFLSEAHRIPKPGYHGPWYGKETRQQQPYPSAAQATPSATGPAASGLYWTIPQVLQVSSVQQHTMVLPHVQNLMSQFLNLLWTLVDCFSGAIIIVFTFHSK